MKDVDKKRRFFIKKSIKFLPLIGVGTFIPPLMQYASYEEKAKISMVIPLEELTTSITKVDKLFIDKRADKIVVYSAHCTHMGCILNIDKEKSRFVCPCHSSEFSYEGVRLKGPAKRNLDIIASYIKDKMLYIG